MKMIPSRLLIVRLAVPPPGSFQTTTASARTIAMLRRFVPRLGPTAKTIPGRRDHAGAGRRDHAGGEITRAARSRGRRDHPGAGGETTRAARSRGRGDHAKPSGHDDVGLAGRRGVVFDRVRRDARRFGPFGHDRLSREPVADPEVRVDVPPARRGALELLAELADEDVDRAVTVDHRVAPDPLVDLLALQHLALGVREQLDELELAAREIDRPAAGERLELVGPDLELADQDRLGRDARLRALATADDGLDAGDQLLRVAGLRQPVVGAQPQAAHTLRHARRAGADDHTELRETGAELLEVGPRLRPEDRE